MHRSGTSVAARSINLLGVPFGRGRLVPVTSANPDGHWESWELQDVNDLLLERLGGSWAGPPDLQPGWEVGLEVEPLRGQARSAWNLVHPGETWLWKDPRTCLTLAFWRSVVDWRGPAVLIYRDPTAVAASLARRDGFSSTISTALWERYNRDALAGMSGWPVMVTSFHRLLDDPTSWLHQVRDFLVASEVVVGDVGQIDVAARSVHNERIQGLADRPDPTLTDEQAGLVQVLDGLQGVHEKWSVPDLGDPSPGLARLLEEHHRAYSTQLALEAELARARSQLGYVINRTRVKVLAYRMYERSPLSRWPLVPALGSRNGRGHVAP
jgi:hypothetical protein